eukprot:11234389-Alexandrium_andersonii.AAC.1
MVLASSRALRLEGPPLSMGGPATCVGRLCRCPGPPGPVRGSEGGNAGFGGFSGGRGCVCGASERRAGSCC